MQQANISIRVDKTVKERFCDLCEEFGLTTTSAINLFMKAVIRERRIPFEISVDENRSVEHQGLRERSIREEGLDAFRKMREIVAESGLEEPTLEEINAEIKAVRDAIR